MKKLILFFSFLLMSIGLWGADSWMKVTSAPADWSGEYLLVYETSSTAGVAWTGVDATNCGASVTISSGIIASKPASAVSITVSTVTGGYSIRINGGTNNGKYVGRSANSNGLDIVNSAAKNTITYASSSSKITGAGGAVLRYNSNNDQKRFRYFKSDTYTNQKVIQLYKKTSSITTYTVTYNVNGGSSVVDADSPYTTGSSVTVKQCGTKNGYTFDSWNVKSDYSGTEFFGGETFTITKDTTFYAKWLKDTTLYATDCNIFAETFSTDTGSVGYKGGNDDIWNGEGTATGTLKFDNEGWEASHGKGANECGKFGTADSIGYAKTPIIQYTGHNNMILSFRCGAWENTNEKETIYLIGDNVKINGQDTITVNIVKSAWNTYTYSLSSDNNFRLTWKSTNESEGKNKNRNRFFLDDICITEASNQLDIISWYDDSIIISKDYFDSILFNANNIRIEDLLQKTTLTENAKGEFEVPVDLHESYCINKKFTVSDGTYALSQTIKIPRIIISPTNTSTISNEDCDVVVQSTLTVSGTNTKNRDVKLYGGAHLSIPSGTEYTVNSLSLRRDNLTPSTVKVAGTLNTNKLYFDLYVDAAEWYFVCLPNTFTLTDLKYTNGRIPQYKKNYQVRYYDGEARAYTQSGAWRNVDHDKTFALGEGFIFGLDNNLKKKEFRFELPVSTLTDEVDPEGKSVSNLHAWGGNIAELRPNHKGWNMIGNPFLNSIVTDLFEPIRSGQLVQSNTDPWDGKWVVDSTAESSGKKLRYAVIPNRDEQFAAAGYYESVVLDDYQLEPFTSFFVQIGGNNPETNQSLTFNTSTRGPLMATRYSVEEEDEELFLRVRVGKYKTGCFISKNFTDEYEPGDDLESRYVIYQTINGYKLLYSAINDSIIEHGVQITSPQGTLYLDPKVDVNKFEYIYAYYNNEWYDLKNGQTVDIEGYFILQAKRKVIDNTTDFESIMKSNMTDKFIYNGHLYIRQNNHVYDVFGERIK